MEFWVETRGTLQAIIKMVWLLGFPKCCMWRHWQLRAIFVLRFWWNFSTAVQPLHGSSTDRIDHWKIWANLREKKNISGGEKIYSMPHRFNGYSQKTEISCHSQVGLERFVKCSTLHAFRAGLTFILFNTNRNFLLRRYINRIQVTYLTNRAIVGGQLVERKQYQSYFQTARTNTVTIGTGYRGALWQTCGS